MARYGNDVQNAPAKIECRRLIRPIANPEETLNIFDFRADESRIRLSRELRVSSNVVPVSMGMRYEKLHSTPAVCPGPRVDNPLNCLPNWKRCLGIGRRRSTR